MFQASRLTRRHESTPRGPGKLPLFFVLPPLDILLTGVYLENMKIIMFLLSILLFSCNKNEGKTLTENTFANNTADIADDKKENDGEEKTGEGFENNNIGIYLPEYYINALDRTKSHIVASKEYYKLNDRHNNAIIIFPDEVMYIFSYHEGASVKILDITSNKIVHENLYDEGLNIIDDDIVKSENGVIFTRISKNVENFREGIASYIALAMFGEKIYRNDDGEEMARIENGNILKNNIEYELLLDTVFLTEYDCIFSRDRKGKMLFLKMNNGMIEVYNQEMQEGYPEEYLEYPLENPYPEYILVDIYSVYP
ncbi:MAG: hypothetical protein LBR93_05545 [Treponema sp.]|jgi:hypothetical protein|nr:hypothetical protein [Treponema sp.]